MIVDDIKSRIKVAMKARDSETLGLLRLVVGMSQQESVDDDPTIEHIMRKMIKNNYETIKLNPNSSEGLMKEIVLLEEFLPKSMSVDEILDLISKENIPLENTGRAIGSVIKIAKQKGLTIQGNDVKKAIAKLSESAS